MCFFPEEQTIIRPLKQVIPKITPGDAESSFTLKKVSIFMLKKCHEPRLTEQMINKYSHLKPGVDVILGFLPVLCVNIYQTWEDGIKMGVKILLFYKIQSNSAITNVKTWMICPISQESN